MRSSDLRPLDEPHRHRRGCVRIALGALTAVFGLAVTSPCAAEESETAVTPPSAPAASTPGPIQADGTPRHVAWDPAWRRFGLADIIITAGAGAAAIVSQVLPPSNPIRGGVLFDEGVRNGLRASTPGGRLFAADASDFLLTFAVAYPLLIDSVVVTAGHYHENDVALQMALMDAEAYALTVGLQATISSLSSRERPYGRTCGDETPGDTTLCLNSNRYRSFFSGHTSIAFTSAGLTCAHHLKLNLYGGGAADMAACIGSLLVAGATSMLRVVSDNHYMSDIVTGTVIGLGSGLGVPLLLHYGKNSHPHGEKDKVEFSVAPMGLGASLNAKF